MTIVPNTSALRLLRAWRDDADGWGVGKPLPIIAVAIDHDLEPLYITPGSAWPLQDTKAEHRPGALNAGVDWADALLDGGQVIDASGNVFSSSDEWLAALIRRDECTT